jgi:serine/threonine protein kinase
VARRPLGHLSRLVNDTAEDLFIGRVVADRYRLVRCVGRGGMGAVYEGFHVQTEKRVAVKILASHLSKDLKLIARFRREAMAASRLDHENCVRVYDFGEDTDGTFYIAMEFVDGRGLGDEIRNVGPMPQARVARVGVQLLSALDAAHASGILHRDLKPQNIMLTRVAGREDVIKVVDFGIAKFISNTKEDQAALTVPGTIFGTPEYMSPEQARGEELDGRSDLYSAAVVLWHLLLGRSPFRGKTVRETLVKVFGENPPSAIKERPTANIEPAFEKALMGGLSKDRDKRWSDAAAFLSALQPFDGDYQAIDPTPQRAPVPGFTPDGAAPETLAGEEASDPRVLALPKRTQIGHVGGAAAPQSDDEKYPRIDKEATAAPPAEAGPYVAEKTVDQDQPDDYASASELASPPVASKPASAAEETERVRRPAKRDDDSTEDDDVAALANVPDDDDLDLQPGGSRGLVIAAVAVIAVAFVVGAVWALVDPSDDGGGQEQPTPEALDVTAPPPDGYTPDKLVAEEAMLLAKSAKSEGHAELAKKMYEKAARADLDNGAIHNALVTICIELGEVEQAEGHLKRLEQIDPKKYAPLIAFSRKLIEAKRNAPAPPGGDDDGFETPHK